MAGVALLACLTHLGFALATGTTTGGETTVKVSATPVFPAIPWAQQRDDFEVLVRVEAPATAQMHAPIDLVVALDVSESMNARPAPRGGPSRLDLLKKAMKFVISKLGDSDRLAIVAFNDHVVEEYSTELLHVSGRHGQCRVKRAIDELESGGRTAFKPALERAVRILDERPTEEDGRVGFVLLVSDGTEDSRITWCNEGIVCKYPVHTFGFSSSHDPRTLHAIAQTSGGTYSFVNDEVLDDGLTGALAMCLGGLKSVVAAHARVVLTAAEKGGVEIKSIDSSSGYVSGDRRWGEIVPGVLYAGEVKNFIVRLHVPAVRCAACDSGHHHRQQLQKLLTVTVSGTGIDSIYMESTATILQIQRPHVIADASRPAPSPAVVSHIVLSELVDLVATFDRDEIGAVAAVDLGGRLENKWEEFAERHKFWSGLDDLLVGLDGDIRAMASSLRRTGGSLSAGAYVYSWVSSYRTQRATAMGSPDKVVVHFVTTRMQQMLKEARDFQADEPIAIGRHPKTSVGDEEDDDDDGTLLDINMEMIDRRLQLWYKLKREVPIMFRQPGETSEDAEWDHLTAITQQASIEAIDRAMHNDMYLAVVHASNARACYSKRRGSEPATPTATTC
ncbi:unnamed protein product [Urochloa humidicola]